ncbi:MAG: hypothetical protein MUO26_05135 [Methanotrichaceae archaeon]|nr:hypothetical protein [Methanotrichaceae archaeon]
MDAPKNLQRFLKKLNDQGENAILIAPAILERHSTQKMRAIVRMGMNENRNFGYIVATEKSVHYVRPGLLWDNVQTISLDKVTGVEYVDEFLTNTLKLATGQTVEKIIFNDEKDGINFYLYINSINRK